MLLLNIDHVPGRDMEAMGLVKGTVVQIGRASCRERV